MATTLMPIEAAILLFFCCLVCCDVFFLCAIVCLPVADFFCDEARLLVVFFTVCLAIFVLVIFLVALLFCLATALDVPCTWLDDFVTERLADFELAVASVVAVLVLVFWTADVLVIVEVCRLTLELAIAGILPAFITTPNP